VRLSKLAQFRPSRLPPCAATWAAIDGHHLHSRLPPCAATWAAIDGHMWPSTTVTVSTRTEGTGGERAYGGRAGKGVDLVDCAWARANGPVRGAQVYGSSHDDSSLVGPNGDGAVIALHRWAQNQRSRKSASAIELRAALCHMSLGVTIMKPFLIALSILAVAAPSFELAESDADGYPPGLFEHSPLVEPSHPAKQARPSATEGPSAHRSRTLGKSGPRPPA
jgi:hypothetical protein